MDDRMVDVGEDVGGTPSFDLLPDELMMHVFASLPEELKCLYRLVDRRWNECLGEIPRSWRPLERHDASSLWQKRREAHRPVGPRPPIPVAGKGTNLCAFLAGDGYDECVWWCHRNRIPWDHRVCSEAARRGDLPLLSGAHRAGCGWTGDASVLAARHGHADCLEYAAANGCPLERPNPPLVASNSHEPSNGHDGTRRTLGQPADMYLDNLGTLLDRVSEYDACEAAAGGGRLDCLRIAHGAMKRVTKRAVMRAARNGHADCFAYALRAFERSLCPGEDDDCGDLDARRSPYRECLAPHMHDIIAAAAWGGREEIMRALIDRHPSPMFRDARVYSRASRIHDYHNYCICAAICGHVGMLRLMVEASGWALNQLNDDDDGSLCVAAARGGSLETLEYLHESGCPWSPAVLCRAAEMGRTDIVVYAVEHGCPLADRRFPSGAFNLLDRAIDGGAVDCVTYLLGMVPRDAPGVFGDAPRTVSNGWWTDVSPQQTDHPSGGFALCANAAAHEDPAILVALRRAGVPWDAFTCSAAARHGSVRCLEYAVSKGCPVSVDAWLEAAGHGGVECLGILLRAPGAEGFLADPAVARAAAVRDRVDCLRFLHAHGAAFHADLLAIVARCGKSDCFEFLVTELGMSENQQDASEDIERLRSEASGVPFHVPDAVGEEPAYVFRDYRVGNRFNALDGLW